MYMSKEKRSTISALILSHRVAIRLSERNRDDVAAKTRVHTTGYMLNYMLGVDVPQNANLLRKYAVWYPPVHDLVNTYAPELLK